MPKYQTELFGQVIYSAEISYDALLALEAEMQSFIVESLEAAGGEFLAFESEGDRTFFQCAFQSCDAKLAEKLAKRFAGRIDKNLESKLMFVDRMLSSHIFYAINSKNTQLEKIELPPAGPIDKALRDEGS